MFRWPWKRETDADQRAAFAELARAHADDVYGAALRMTRNRDDAYDLAQEAVVRAFTHFDSFTPGTNFKAWMLRILTNLYISDYCRKRKAPTLPLEGEGEGVIDVEDVGSQDNVPGRALFEEALDEEIGRALDSLGGGVRLCILMVDVEQMSYEEAAAALGVPVGTVRSRLNRGREQLKRALAEYARGRNLV
jgi:RNA polymerase sigma-70 factor, ECF subfamily